MNSMNKFYSPNGELRAQADSEANLPDGSEKISPRNRTMHFD
ncbi:MAG: hypothetical protein SOW15_06930 [Ruminococcus callidus]|nr:hypothetical protein [Ruminococcus callidus]